MKPITTFNGWLIGKITSYLTSREGCTVQGSEYYSDGVRTTVMDAMGFRYEIQVRTLGRAVTGDVLDFEEGRYNSYPDYLEKV